MITNERQYKISKLQLSKLRNATESFNLVGTSKRIGSDILARAELDALRSEAEILTEQVEEYENLKSGTVTILTAQSLEELPRILIQARISKDLSQRKLAEILNLKEQQIQRYESENYASASLRRLTEVSHALRLNISEVAELMPAKENRTSPKAPDVKWDAFPVQEMYRRGWFRALDFGGSMAAAVASRIELAKEYVQIAMPRRQLALLRQRARFGAQMDRHALLAWQCRIFLLAQEMQPAAPYSRDTVTDEWLRALVKQSRFEDGPCRAKQILSEAGISLLIEPHLPQTYLDGAALILPNGSPAIGMTLRYDRLDNFWFVLLHELIHVSKHLSKGKLEDIFDDLDAPPDKLELETDSLAASALIPANDWEIALARYVRTEDSITSFAAKHRIHPAIVAGRIRKEADNYTILTDLVGSGKVRSLFPEIQFGQ